MWFHTSHCLCAAETTSCCGFAWLDGGLLGLIGCDISMLEAAVSHTHQAHGRELM